MNTTSGRKTTGMHKTLDRVGGDSRINNVMIVITAPGPVPRRFFNAHA